MDSFVNSEEYTSGPYDKCLKCAYLGKKCDGPRTSAMEIDRWWMWCRALKEARKMTNDGIAAKSGYRISTATVERIMRGKVSSDIQRYTAAVLEDTLIGSDGKYPCPMDILSALPKMEEKLAEKTEECEHLKRVLENIHSAYKSEMGEIRAEAQRKIDYLREENAKKDAIISRLLER